jgi:hypothetical protein
MINETVIWKEPKNNLKTRQYTQALYQGGAVEDDFCIRYHFNQIRSLDYSIPIVENVNSEEKIYILTNVYDAFGNVINKEKNISSTRAIKIQAKQTIQIERHSKTLVKNYTTNTIGNYVIYEIIHGYQDQCKCYHIFMYFLLKKMKHKKI